MAFQIKNITPGTTPNGASGPLSDLNDPSFTYDIYKYPIVQTPDNPADGHSIIFYINTPQSSYWSTAPGIQTSSDIQPVANRGSFGGAFGLRNPQDYTVVSNSGVTLDQLNKSNATNNQLLTHFKRTNIAIALYVPNTLIFGQNMQYENVSLTDSLGVLGNIGYGALLLGEGQKKQGLATLGGLAGIIPQSHYLSTDSLLKIIKQGIDLADNPQNLLLFRQIDFRKFQFDFILTPENQTEANNIQEIIYQFRFNSAPEVAEGSMGRYFIPPGSFDIEILHNGQINSYIPKISTCYLETINVDYAAAGEWVSHWDGSPVMTRLTLNFTEATILTKDRISQGF